MQCERQGILQCLKSAVIASCLIHSAADKMMGKPVQKFICPRKVDAFFDALQQSFPASGINALQRAS